MNISKIVETLPAVLRRHTFIRLLMQLFPNDNIQLVRFNDCAKVFADLNDANARQYLITGCFEPEFFTIAEPFLRCGGCFFDVGANFGFCSFGLMAKMPETTISFHLFEAN